MKGFIIDTDSYAGNFEREMCAYTTGHIGDCGVGAEETEEYLKKHELIDEVTRVADVEQTDYYRPVNIYPTEGVWNNGLGFHFKEGEETQALEAYKEYFKKYREASIRTVEGHRGKNIPTWTDEAIDKTIERERKELVELTKKTEVEKFPAYQSVLIYLDSKPEVETIEFMKKRAIEYAKTNKITVTGFRFLEIKEETESI